MAPNHLLIASIFRVESDGALQHNANLTRPQPLSALLGLFFEPEDGGEMFPLNVVIFTSPHGVISEGIESLTTGVNA
jgi:hypothetical protein